MPYKRNTETREPHYVRQANKRTPMPRDFWPRIPHSFVHLRLAGERAVIRLALGMLIVIATARLVGAQEQTHVGIGECSRAVDDLCDRSEGYYGHSLGADPVPRGSIRDDFPPCVGDIDSWINESLKQAGAWEGTFRDIGTHLPGWLPFHTGQNKATCAVLGVRIPVRTRISRVALTVSDPGPGGCAIWVAGRDGSLPIFGKQNRCSPQTHTGYDQPRISDDGRTVAVAFKNWSDTTKRYGYLRVYYIRVNSAPPR
jgi:hypothetical protein